MTQVQHDTRMMDPTGFETLEIISRAAAFNRWMYENIQPWLKGDILEIGSGTGNISDFVVKDGYAVSLSDYNPAYCSILSEKYRQYKNVQDIFPIDVQDNNFVTTYQSLHEKYDTIYLLNVIEHVQDDAKLINYCTYMLRPGGRLILLAPAYQSLFSRLDTELGHYRRYSIQDFKQLFMRSNYLILNQQYFNVLGLLGWFFYGKIAGQKQLAASEFSLFNKLVPVARLLDKLARHKAGLSVIVIAEKN